MTARLAHIFRHPIKGHGREPIASVGLLAGQCLPWDRHWAVAHDAASLSPGWNACVNFARGAKAPALMAITAILNEANCAITLMHPDQGTITFQPDDPADLSRFLDWVRPLNPEYRSQPDRIYTDGAALTDTDFPSVSILSLSTLADLSGCMRQDLSLHRWRGNLWLAGAEPWAEFGWIGRSLRIGGAVLQIKERITRCKATTIDPETGVANGDTLTALESNFDHQDFGVYAIVVESGPIAVGDVWSLQ